MLHGRLERVQILVIFQTPYMGIGLSGLVGYLAPGAPDAPDVAWPWGCRPRRGLSGAPVAHVAPAVAQSTPQTKAPPTHDDGMMRTYSPPLPSY